MTSPLSTTRCERCDAELEPSIYPLFIVTGVSGVGKSSVIPALIGHLPEHIVLDVDELYGLGLKFGWEVKRNALLRFAAGIGRNGRSTVLCGTIYRDGFSSLPARTSLGAIHFLNLHCDAELREQRLRPRLERLSWTEEKIQEFFRNHRRMAAEFQDEFEETVNVTEMSIGEVANVITEWIEMKTQSADAGDTQ